jgi:hypothetical protein
MHNGAAATLSPNSRVIPKDLQDTIQSPENGFGYSSFSASNQGRFSLP